VKKSDATFSHSPCYAQYRTVEAVTLTIYTRSKKWDQQYIEHNFDKFKYIVVIFCKEYYERNAKLLTQQKSA